MAFCYIANELTDDQRAQFETRLADDQSARDAVEQAVGIAQAVYDECVYECPATVELPQRGRQSLNVDRRMWVLCGLAAALLLSIGLVAWMPDGAQPPTENVVQGEDEDLAIAWADAIQTPQSFEPSLDVENNFQLASLSLDEDDSEDDWMYIAVHELNEPDDEESEGLSQ